MSFMSNWFNNDEENLDDTNLKKKIEEADSSLDASIQETMDKARDVANNIKSSNFDLFEFNLEQFSNSISDSVFFLNEQLEIYKMNSVAFDLLAIDKESFEPTFILNFFPKEKNDETSLIRRINCAKDVDKTVLNCDKEKEYYICCKKGNDIPVTITISMQTRRDGSFYYIMILKDLSVWKENEEKLEILQQKFEQTSNATLEGIIIYDSKTETIENVNKSACNMFEYEEKDLLGMNIHSLIAPEYIPLSVEHESKKVNMDFYELMGQKRNGEKFPIEISRRSALYNGISKRIVAICDKTKQKEREKHLEAFQRAFDNSRDKILVMKVDGEITYHNNEFFFFYFYDLNDVEYSYLMGEDFFKTIKDSNILRTYITDDVIRKVKSGKLWRKEIAINDYKGNEILTTLTLIPIINGVQKAPTYIMFYQLGTEALSENDVIDITENIQGTFD